MRRSAVRLAALVAAVAAVHLLLTDAALEHLQGLAGPRTEPARLMADYTAQVRLAPPRTPPPPTPAAPPEPARPAHRPAAKVLPPAASAASSAASPPPAASQPRAEPQQAGASAPQPEASGVRQADAASAAASGADPATDGAAAVASAQAASPAASGAPSLPPAFPPPLAPPSPASAPATASAGPPAASSQPVAAASAAPASAASSAVAGASESATASAATDADRPFGFDWPQATRIRYKLKGNYRGEVHGKAEVEWLRQGLHYQVHVDLDVALLFSRRVSSDGQITATGLAPRHFVEEVKATMFSLRKQRIEFGDEQVTLANGDRVPTQPGLQDEASQFVQLTYEFIRHPERLQAGRTVTLQLVRVRSRKLEPYVYDVMPPEDIDTPMGPVRAWRLSPRPDPARARTSDWILELWFAPALEYLPVRLRIANSDPAKNIYADLVIDRLPERAQAAARGGAAGSR